MSTPVSRDAGRRRGGATTAGAGLGSVPWAARTVPVADRDRAERDLVDAEHLERGAGADDVDDRVERADLVEVDVVGSARRGARPRPRRAR